MANLPWEVLDLLEDPNEKWEAFHAVFFLRWQTPMLFG